MGAVRAVGTSASGVEVPLILTFRPEGDLGCEGCFVCNRCGEQEAPVLQFFHGEVRKNRGLGHLCALGENVMIEARAPKLLGENRWNGEGVGQRGRGSMLSGEGTSLP